MNQMNQILYADCYEAAKFIGIKSANASWFLTKFFLSNCYRLAKSSLKKAVANSHKIPTIYKQSKSTFKEGLEFCGSFISLIRQKKKNLANNSVICKKELVEDLNQQHLITRKSFF